MSLWLEEDLAWHRHTVTSHEISEVESTLNYLMKQESQMPNSVNFSTNIHRIKAADVTIAAKHHDTTDWISIDFGSSDLALFAATKADFDLLCRLFNINRNEELSVDPAEITS